MIYLCKNNLFIYNNHFLAKAYKNIPKEIKLATVRTACN